MLKELPRNCSIGVKTSSKGHQQYWRGYKLHLDVGDGQIPISAVLIQARRRCMIHRWRAMRRNTSTEGIPADDDDS